MTHAHDTHPPHGDPDAPLLVGRIGITRGVLGFVLAAVLCSIMQGSFVVSASATGRVWPSIESTKLPLPAMNLQPQAQ